MDVIEMPLKGEKMIWRPIVKHTKEMFINENSVINAYTIQK